MPFKLLLDTSELVETGTDFLEVSKQCVGFAAAVNEELKKHDMEHMDAHWLFDFRQFGSEEEITALGQVHIVREANPSPLAHGLIQDYGSAGMDIMVSIACFAAITATNDCVCCDAPETGRISNAEAAAFVASFLARQINASKLDMT